MTKYDSHRTDEDKPRLLFIGNFSDSRKGHSLLIPVAKRLIDEGYRFELLCAGAGSELEYWKKQCDNYLNIIFLGHVTNIADYLCKSNMLIVPSLIDSCPNTVLEGLNAGVTVYGCNTGGIPDLLVDEKYMFEPDENSLYAFLKKVLDNKEYIVDAQSQTKRKQELSFDWVKRIKNIIEK